MTELNTEPTRADTAYRWTVRTVYLLAIVLNLYVLIASMKETPEGREILIRLDRLRSELTRPLRQRRADRVEANRVILEAWSIVEGAK